MHLAPRQANKCLLRNPFAPPQASFNKLTTLPPELGTLPNLELLRVACCEIKEVPGTMAAAPRLAWLSLAGNPVCRGLAPRPGAVPEVKEGDLELGEKLGERERALSGAPPPPLLLACVPRWLAVRATGASPPRARRPHRRRRVWGGV